MGTIKKITAVKRRALCPKCFSVIQWDNATFERYDSETDSYYIICPAELNGSNCGQKININKIDPNTYLDSDIIFEPVEGGETISIDSEDVNFNSSDTTLRASNVKEAINELDDNINNLNGNNISYNNAQSELESENVQSAIDELKENINKIDEKEIQAKNIIYDNIDSDLTAENVQDSINELNEKINNINIDTVNTEIRELKNKVDNIITGNTIPIVLMEEKNVVNGITSFKFSGLNSLVDLFTIMSSATTFLVSYKVSLNIIHPTFINKTMCSITYQQSTSNNETLYILIGNTETITVTNNIIIWKTADSNTINIPINGIASDGTYTYTIS